MNRFDARRATALALLLGAASASAQEDIGFVSEHLPEVAMDNRYAQLPAWNACEKPREYCGSFDLGHASTHSQTLSIDGPMFTAALTHDIGAWQLSALLFFDPLRLGSGLERRPLEVDFVAGVPYSLPVAAQFTHLDGSARDFGAGVSLARDATVPWVGIVSWTAGLLWQEMSLRDFRYDYLILAGPDAGSAGQIDYSADYRHLVPFAGLAWPRRGRRWGWTPHLQVAMPLPRRGMQGRISGPGFDLRGNQQDFGAGRHFGDPSVTLGFDVTYLPWHLSLDVGSAFSQYLLEPHIHEGIDRNLLLTVRWSSAADR
jgi:hypothetical protein